MTFAMNSLGLFPRVVFFMDKIIKSVTSADLPVKQPIKCNRVFNLTTVNKSV